MRRFTILILPTQQRRGRMGWEFGVRVRLEALDWTGLEGQGLRVLFSGRALHVNLVAAEMPRLRLEASEQAPQGTGGQGRSAFCSEMQLSRSGEAAEI